MTSEYGAGLVRSCFKRHLLGPTAVPFSLEAKYKYATSPPNISTMPPGVPYIIGNEAAERFSFYGMRSILIIFMTHYLVTSGGAPDHMSEAEARQNFALFVSAVYFLPILGAILAEGFIGKYQTIFWLSIVYCFGHFALALNDTRLGLVIGLGLIAFGSGGIKPCVSANVGAIETWRHPRVVSTHYVR